MNILFLINAGILTVLGVLLFAAKRDRLTAIFLAANVGLAFWNVGVYLLEEGLLAPYVNAIVKVQLVSVMLFANAYYWLCASYPAQPRPSRLLLYGNALGFFGLALALLGSDNVTRAELREGAVVFIDNPIGYALYTGFMLTMFAGCLHRLLRSHRRYPQHRPQIKYLLLGCVIFGFCAITFNAVFPLLGIYDYLIVGRLAAMFPALFFAHVVIKHSFLDMTVIINRVSAWAITFVIVALSFAVVHVQMGSIPPLEMLLLTGLGLFWSVFAAPLQKFLLTSAKRKFVRGWYNTDEVISELSERITLEKNREDIFRTIEAVLDKVLELEKSLAVVAERDELGNCTHYRLLDSNQRLTTDDALIGRFLQDNSVRLLESCDAEIIDFLEPLGYRQNRRTVILPFHSPEFLEGLLVLGDRSSQALWSDSDLKFFRYLASFISAVLYRLTPMEKLERHYFENRQRLHEAEIQLIRAQKIESIVHATRQCHHEIRTPLNIIRLGIGRIRTLADLEAYKAVATEEISRALEIVEETLTITDVTKASPDRFASININEVVARCAKLVDQSRYRLRMDLDEVPAVWGSFSDVQVALTNLIHNALDAMPEGGTLSLSTATQGGNAVIRVEDTGRGIPTSLRSRVWEPYFSGHATEAGNSTAGRGWGLTIVNRIITEHTGTINFTSEEGIGTRFTIVLPPDRRGQAEAQEEGKVLPFPRRRG